MENSLAFLNNFKKIYFISSHLDDVIFSCSSLIRILSYYKECIIVTVFTSDPGVQLTNIINHNYFVKENNIRALPRLRRKEDIVACKKVGASFIHLEFTDAIFRTGFKFSSKNFIYNPTNPDLFHKDSMDLHYSIEHSIQNHIQISDANCYFLPLAIGNHIDHVLIKYSFNNLIDKQSVFYYEDFPYNFYSKNNDLLNYKSILSIEYDKNKLNDILTYESQIVPIFNNVNSLNCILKSQKYESYYSKL